jgi:hypothetical protein
VTNPSSKTAVSLLSPHTTAPRWTRDQIRAARLAPLLPLLEKRGLHPVETGGGNFEVREHPGLVIKDSYWRWPEHEIGGNAIDLYTKVLRLGFHDAMRELCPP